jgi:hypothetical protein
VRGLAGYLRGLIVTATDCDRMAKRIAYWLHENSFLWEHSWDAIRDVPYIGGKYLVPENIVLCGITEEWLAEARNEPRDAIYDLLCQVRRKTDCEDLELSEDDFLEIINRS